MNSDEITNMQIKKSTHKKLSILSKIYTKTLSDTVDYLIESDPNHKKLIEAMK